MHQTIYLDYNATTPVDSEVTNELIPYIHTHYGNPSSNYTLGKNNKKAIETARNQVANLINANPEEIIFTGSATEANNMAIKGFALANRDKGRHIITSNIEHPAVLEVCKHLETIGFDISYIPVNSQAIINPEDVKKAIRPDTILISIMHANNEVGTIQPITEIASLAHKHNIIIHTDAAQSIGKINTDVKKLNTDMLSIAGHKLYAPKGIGALYIKKGTKINNIIYGAGQENELRPGTENVAFIVALGKASEIAVRDFNKNVDIMHTSKQRILKKFKSKLKNKVIIHAEFAQTLPNTLSLAFPNISSQTLTSKIGGNICISTGSACHDNTNEISYVLQAMNIDYNIACSTVRISTGKYSTLEEIDIAIDKITNIIQQH